MGQNPYEPLFGHQLIQSFTQLQGSLGKSSMDRTARRHNQSDAFYPSIISTSVRRALKKKLSAFSIFVETPVQPLKNISDIEGQDTSTNFFSLLLILEISGHDIPARKAILIFTLGASFLCLTTKDPKMEKFFFVRVSA